MVGFVGTRARKRRRRNLYIFLFIFLILLIIVINPEFDLNQDAIKPDENIIPEANEEITSNLSKIEDLKLTIFQKEQKIKFRDEQINNLKTQIKDLKNNFTNINSKLVKTKKDYDQLIESENSKNTVDINLKKLNSLNKEIEDLKISNKKNQKLVLKLNGEIKILINENKKLLITKDTLLKNYENLEIKNNEQNNIIYNLEKILEDQKKTIKNLKDNSHHNQ